MAKKKPSLPDPVHVYPATAMLERGEYLAGVGVDGADVPPELAQEWVDAGLATLEPPAALPDQPPATPAVPQEV